MYSACIRQRAFLRLLAVIVASLFMLHSALAYVDVAKHSGGSQVSGTLCVSPQPTSDTGGNSKLPAVPVGTHHGSCCIIHSTAIDVPDRASHAYFIRMLFPEAVFKFETLNDVRTELLDPSGAPQSPRAPPHRI